jgi:hypothetical protein
VADNDREVSAETLGSWLGVTAMSVNDLTRRGVIDRKGRGRWLLKYSTKRRYGTKSAYREDCETSAPRVRKQQFKRGNVLMRRPARRCAFAQ